MRKLASIQRIDRLENIPGADLIEKATVKGWQCVVKKGEFDESSLCVFIEVDSVLPEEPHFEFMRKNDFRVRTVKLRGQISQGLALPISILGTNVLSITEDQDVTEILGIKKFERQEFKGGELAGDFPYFLKKTDEIRVQACPKEINKLVDKEIYVTEKMDGCSMSIWIKDGEFGAASRNFQLRLEGDSVSTMGKFVVEEKLEERLKELSEKIGVKNLALQGEFCGPSIQANKLKLSEQNFYVFNIFDIDNQKYLCLPAHTIDLIVGGEFSMVPVLFSCLDIEDLLVMGRKSQLEVPWQCIMNLSTRKSRLN